MSYTAFIILILIVAIALILIVMVQNPKGGGLSSSFGGGGGAQSLGGVQNTNNFLDRTTWTLAIAMFALILLSNVAIPREGANNVNLDNTLEGTAPIENTTTPTTNDSIK
jgi:preprotein translocase subunit SecG